MMFVLSFTIPLIDWQFDYGRRSNGVLCKVKKSKREQSSAADAIIRNFITLQPQHLL